MSRHPGERWDRARFEDAGRRGTVIEETDYYRGPPRRDRSADISYRKPSYAPERERPREKERIVFEEREERYGAPVPYRPRPRQYYEEDEVIVDREVVPYRRERERGEERELEIDIRRRGPPMPPPAPPRGPARPQFVRRQSSLDTFDRRPLPRYGDRIREEIPIPARPRRRSPPRYVEREEIEIRRTEPERDYYEEEDDYRGGWREREVVTERRRRAPSVSTVVYEEKEEVIETEFPKRGKTKMPTRLINERAIIQLGYPFEKEVCQRSSIPIVHFDNLGRYHHHSKGPWTGAD